MTKNITERLVQSLKPPAKGCYYVFDTEPRGFAVRITAVGTRTFTLDYRNARGENRRYNIGQWSETMSVAKAVSHARKLLGQIEDGHDPVQEKKDKRQKLLDAPTVADLKKSFYEKYVLVENGEDQRRNARDLLKKVEDRWGRMKPDDVTQGDVKNLHNSMRDTPYRANRMLSVISKMFNWGVDNDGLCSKNPAKGVERFDEDKRVAWLTEQQLQNLDRAISEYGEESAELIRLLMLTGYRRREWMRARKVQFDMAHATWTKPSHSVKKREWEQVRLGKPVMEVLRRVMASNPESEFLFPGKVKGKPRTTIRKTWEQVLRKAGLVQERNVTSKAGNVLKRYKPLFRLHDLRHSYASWLAEHGKPLLVIQKALGHLDPMTTDRYSHIADQSAVGAQDDFGDMLTQRPQ